MKSFCALLVDDEEEFLATLIKRLKKRNVDVIGASNGREALKKLEQEKIDIVVLDVRMPGLDGIETLREIKKQHPLIEVLMLTGHANVDVAVEGMESGAFDYLMKPVDIDNLLFKMEDAYKKKFLQEKKIKNLEDINHSKIKK